MAEIPSIVLSCPPPQIALPSPGLPDPLRVPSYLRRALRVACGSTLPPGQISVRVEQSVGVRVEREGEGATRRYGDPRCGGKHVRGSGQ